MADGTKTLDIVINAKDEASRTIRGIGSTFGDLAKEATTASAGILASLGLAAKGAIDTAANFEQAKTAFTTFLGDGEKAGKLLQQLSDFAAKTPFDLPQVVEGGKRLLAMGVEADKLIPTFRMLGDISGGNTEKLNSLVLAYGQVKAATKLTGAELRQFTEAGVPLLDMLAKELNKNGGALVTMGGAGKGAKEKIDALNKSLAKQNNRLTEMKNKHQEGSASFKNLNIDIQANKDKLAGLSAESKTYTTRVKVTAESLRDMISEGAVSFQDVEAALKTATSQGGRFFNAMESQSKTLTGVISNTRDEIIRFALTIMGMSTTGDIREGSIFFYLKEGAEKLLKVIQDIRPQVASFVDVFLKEKDNVLILAGALAGLFAPLLIAAAPAIAAAIAFSVAFAAVVAIFVLLRDALGGAAQALSAMAAGVGVLSAAWAALNIVFGLSPIGAIVIAAAALATSLGILITQTDTFKTKQELLTDATNRLLAAEQELQGLRDVVKQAYQEETDAKIALESATLRLEQSQKIYNQTLAKYGPTSFEARQAANQLEVAKNDLKKANDRLATATDTVIKKEDEFAKKVDEVEEASKKKEEVLKREIGWWENLNNAIAGVIGKLNEYVSKAINAGSVGGILTGNNKRQHGGYVPGGINDAVPMVLHGGERVIPRNGTDVNQGLQSSVNININGSFQLDSPGRVNELAQTVIDMINRQNEIASKGLSV